MTVEKNVRTISNTIGKVFKILLLSSDDFLGDHDFNVTVSNDYYPEARIEFGLSSLQWEQLEPLSDFFKAENINWRIQSVNDDKTNGNSIALYFDHNNHK